MGAALDLLPAHALEDALQPEVDLPGPGLHLQGNLRQVPPLQQVLLRGLVRHELAGELGGQLVALGHGEALGELPRPAGVQV